MNKDSWQSGLDVCAMIRQHHQEAYLVGGCIRDWLLEKEVQDIDIATSATPNLLIEWFTQAGYSVILTGLKHGTVTVGFNGFHFEVTTYRVDLPSLDYRHPRDVLFTHSLKEDCARRDFTMNALCYYPDEGLLDYFNGQQDLKEGIIRCIGNPHQRFQEDALRLFRAIRFCSVYNFSIEPLSASALVDQWPLLSHIAMERIAQELQKTVCAKGWHSVLTHYADLFGQLFVDWQEVVNSPTKRQEALLYSHRCPPLFILRITGLFLADQNQEAWAERRFHHWSKLVKLSKKMSQTLSHLIQLQNTPLRCHRVELRQFLSTYQEYFESLVTLQEVKGLLNLSQAHQLRMMADTIIQQDCIHLHQLAINGRHLLQFAAKQRNVILNACLTAVMQELVVNNQAELLGYIDSLPQNIRMGD